MERTSAIQKTRAALKHLGAARTLQLAIQRSTPPWIFDFNSLHALEVHFEDWDFVPTPDDWPYRWGTEEDAELLTGGGFSLEYVRYLFSCGGRPVLLEKDGELATYVWYLPHGGLHADWIWIVPGPGEVVTKGHQVLPKFRGQRIYQKTQNFAYSQLQAEGYTGLPSVVEALNRSTLKAGASGRDGAGPRRYIGRVSYLRILGLVIFRMSGDLGAKKWGVGFWSQKHPYRLSFDFFHETGSRKSAQALR